MFLKNLEIGLLIISYMIINIAVIFYIGAIIGINPILSGVFLVLGTLLLFYGIGALIIVKSGQNINNIFKYIS